MSETREAKRWAVGQKRRGDLYDLHGEVIASNLTYVVKKPLDRLAGRDDYDWECEIIDGKTTIGRDFKGTCWFRDGAPSTIISGAHEAQPEKPMRSGPGVVPVVGMVVDYRRTERGVVLTSCPWTVIPDGPYEEANQIRVSKITKSKWDAGCYDILSTPVQQPSPSHVCNGKPCGEDVWKHTPSAWGPVFPSLGRQFCSPACRDAWKPEARAAAGDDDIHVGVKRGDCSSMFCLSNRIHDDDEAAQRHRQPSPAAPSPAPWRCANVDVGDYDCTTPGAPPQGPVGPRAPQPGGFCVVCYDKLAASITAPAKSRFVPEPLATFFLPGSIPVVRQAWRTYPAEWKPDDDSSIWSD